MFIEIVNFYSSINSIVRTLKLNMVSQYVKNKRRNKYLPIRTKYSPPLIAILSNVEKRKLYTQRIVSHHNPFSKNSRTEFNEVINAQLIITWCTKWLAEFWLCVLLCVFFYCWIIHIYWTELEWCKYLSAFATDCGAVRTKCWKRVILTSVFDANSYFYKHSGWPSLYVS